MTARMEERMEIVLHQMSDGDWYRVAEIGMRSWTNQYRLRMFYLAHTEGFIERREQPGTKPGFKTVTYRITEKGLRWIREKAA